MALHVLPLVLSLAVAGLAFYVHARMAASRSNNVVVLVLGDLGHSPRMQNHTLSLANHGFAVDLIGYSGSPVRKELLDHPAVRLVHLHPPSKMKVSSRIMFVVKGILRASSQIVSLLVTIFWRIERPKYLIVQNPPAIPTLAIAQFASLTLGCRLIIDWHNFGFSLMPESLRQNSISNAILTRYEQWVGHWAYVHMCVTQAMANELRTHWGVKGKIIVVYDKPASHFKPISIERMHNLFCRLDISVSNMRYLESPTTGHDTILTALGKDNLPHLKQNRPAVIISSTSWTPDEDFSIFMDALVQYDNEARASQCKLQQDEITGAAPGLATNCKLPDLLVIITGKGPLKEEFEKRALELELLHVTIKFAWLTPEDYPLMVASADLGISLHTSSSGLDLPMKIIDMFGCGVPACSFYYPSVSELVQERYNGLHFRNPEELCRCLVLLFRGFPEPNDLLAKLRVGVYEYRKDSWDAHWEQNVLSVLRHA